MSSLSDAINRMKLNRQASNRRKQRHSKLMQKYESYGATWAYSYEKKNYPKNKKNEIKKRVKKASFLGYVNAVVVLTIIIIFIITVFIFTNRKKFIKKKFFYHYFTLSLNDSEKFRK